ncbi:MAG: hypothetical protein HYV14_14735 [Elusimicrobia bacterium]|nr:hypothetical protein [Elusimicrobiota bacterium]
MRTAALVVLAAALAACGKTPEPPKAPTPAAVGAELATFPQLLVPISTSTWASMQAAAARNDPDHANANQYPRPYAHHAVRIDGRDVPVITAYTGVWLAPAPVPLQPMSVQQYLRAFGADADTDLASVIAPKGTIFFTREQLPDVIAAARAAGATSEDLPYGIVHGVAR